MAISTCGAVLLVFVLTGCSVPSQGLLAIGKDAGGDFIGVVQLCAGHVDGMTVYRDGGAEDPTRKFRFSAPTTETGTVDLGDLTSVMHPGKRFASYAWSDDDSSSARGPDVTIEDLEALQPGEVFGLDYAQEDPTPGSMATARFRAGVSKHCDDFS